MPKVRKAELSFLYVTYHLILFYISTKYHQNILNGIWVTAWHKINFKNKTKGDNSKRKQEAYGPWLAHLSDTATADVQMLCNSFLIL